MAIPDLTTVLAERYRVTGPLGAGGMATVYRADDLRHGRAVAIKALRPELGVVLGADRFLQEIRTTAGLQHPNILPLLDSGEAAGQVYYVMPLVEGETLRGRLARERQLPVAETIRLLKEIADALQYAHEQGVIHRDIRLRPGPGAPRIRMDQGESGADSGNFATRPPCGRPRAERRRGAFHLGLWLPLLRQGGRARGNGAGRRDRPVEPDELGPPKHGCVVEHPIRGCAGGEIRRSPG
ncbi:MAG: serine/threonine-protein kinase [Gemmatimonadales bacterium]